jgi:hypothetical protein
MNCSSQVESRLDDSKKKKLEKEFVPISDGESDMEARVSPISTRRTLAWVRMTERTGRKRLKMNTRRPGTKHTKLNNVLFSFLLLFNWIEKIVFFIEIINIWQNLFQSLSEQAKYIYVRPEIDFAFQNKNKLILSSWLMYALKLPMKHFLVENKY